MELQTISWVSKEYGVSPRMLRYYEQVGLIQSGRREGYAYRVYDEANLIRLRQIIMLRKLRVPVKQIVSILNNADAAEATEIFRQNISQLDEEITALSTVRSILTRFVQELSEKADIRLQLLGDEVALLGTLSFSNNRVQEGSYTMAELNSANRRLDKYEDKDVRIVYLPPMTVAAAFASGEDCEGQTMAAINRFATESDLFKHKPDTRSFGFDCSPESAVIGQPSRVYESWVSVPENMPIPAPLVRREFHGGLYAAHVLTNWDFTDWRLLREWVEAGEQYENDWGAPRWASEETVFGQGFEETLNFVNYVQNGADMRRLQLDLLFPIRERVTGS